MCIAFMLYRVINYFGTNSHIALMCRKETIQTKPNRVLRPNMICDGDVPSCSDGVLRQVNSANKGFSLSSTAFSMSRFAIFTAPSLFPLLCG